MKGFGAFLARILYELMTTPLSLFDDTFLNVIVMLIIDEISFYVAFDAVGELGFRGQLGSEVHWTVRLIICLIIYLACCICIRIILFIKKYFIYVCGVSLLLGILIALIIYAKNHPNSRLNKKLYK